METEASHQQLLGNDNSPNLTQEPLTDNRTARNLMDRDIPRKSSDDQGEDKAAGAESPEGNEVNHPNDESPTFREKEEQGEGKSPDVEGEDDGIVMMYCKILTFLIRKDVTRRRRRRRRGKFS